MYLIDDLNPTGYLQVLEEVSRGIVQAEYTYGTTLVSQTRSPGAGGRPSYYGYDGQGNVAFLTDALGSVTDQYEYDAFGDLLAMEGATPNSRLFGGEEVDSDLGLINLRARQYNPNTGRFFTIDPFMGMALSPLSFNRYVYANSDPVNLRDPLGLAAAGAESSGLIGGITGSLIKDVAVTMAKGAVAGAGLAVLAHKVACIDVDQASNLAAVVSGEQAEQEPIRVIADVLGCGKITCQIKCSVAENSGFTKDAKYQVSAQGRGTTKFAACAVAEKTCRNSTPRGYRTVHCDRCQNYRKCWRG